MYFQLEKKKSCAAVKLPQLQCYVLQLYEFVVVVCIMN